MFEITTAWIAPVVIAFGVVLRPYILKYMGKKGFVPNLLYFIVLMFIVVPLEMYHFRFTLTSLDDESAKRVVSKVLQSKILSEYKTPTNVLWKPYDAKKKLYNIKANIQKNEETFNIYMQTKCEFFKGCELALKDIVILSQNDRQNRAIQDVTQEMFFHRPCSDKIAQDMAITRVIPGIFKILFDKFSKIKDTHADYKLENIGLSSAKEFNTAEKLKVDAKNYTLVNECKADLKLEGYFHVISKEGDSAKPILKYMFRSLQQDKDLYLLEGPFYFNIYTDDSNVNVMGTFLTIKKKK
ncbi:hypothetical protein [Sulfurimonas paralvinellae]|uniref:Uncharacterized protein n=1 Tax=Sulfurimonas paralvinellae TaxID=317658 RepID=A0A7M1B5W8_9BACT|nr:hypothetical protein [Sulfurimonas paralvinellae]QOP45060.1 hypothetical protein FM071_01610 [Sulfurimonas paralvinellae]